MKYGSAIAAGRWVVALVTAAWAGWLAPATAGAQAWSVGSSIVVKEWDSGMTSNLSEWKTIACSDTHGRDYLLTGLQAFRDHGSTDNYIAKLVGECTRYVNLNGHFLQDGDVKKAEIFVANHRDPGEWIRIGMDEYMAGIVLEVDNWNDFVQAFYFHKVTERTPGLLGSYANPMITHVAGASTGYIKLRKLQCPDQHVVTGVSLRYDERKGKIRRFRIHCRPLTSN